MAVNMVKGNYDRLKCFTYHKDISHETQMVMESVRQFYVNLAEFLIVALPEGRSKSIGDIALTYLEESEMRAIQSLALSGTPDVHFIIED